MLAFLILLGHALKKNEMKLNYQNRVSTIMCLWKYKYQFGDELCYPRPSIAIIGVF